MAEAAPDRAEVFISNSHQDSTDAAFICDCDVPVRSACAGEPFYQEHGGKRYCVLHFPGAEKSADFEKALRRKLAAEDFNLSGVWFPDRVDFSGYNFNAEASFISATFNAEASFRAAKFSAEASFISAKFSAEASFRAATFGAEASFISATFGANASFFSATFGANASFISATFGAKAYFFSATFNAEASFRATTFGAKASFSSAHFKDEVRFAGGEKSRGFTETSFLTFAYARIEKPELVSFHTLALRPHWFINVDARKFDFTYVEWPDLKRHGLMQRDSIKQVIEKAGGEGSSLHTLLAQACRHLAVNAEENHRYEEAAQFRYWAMDVRLRERWRGWALWKLSFWYWAASGYGERIFQAFLVLVGVWFVFALLYTQVSFGRPPTTLTDESSAASVKRIEFEELRELPSALAYSLGVMTLQRPEPRPETTEAKTLVAVETVLGPLQAALLALAIRRKFMR